MKSFQKIAFILSFLAVSVNSFAQTKADIFDPSKSVTWLGIDYSLTKFIGTPTNTSIRVSALGIPHTKENGVVTNDEFRDVYTSQWNNLFIDEQKKYDIAKAINRSSVKYALDVTEKANKALTKKTFFSNNPADFKTIDASTIDAAVKNYDFLNNDGIGLMFFVEGMSKGVESMGIWVTFVDMKSKTVLFTSYQTEKPGGGGFRNYWARPFSAILKDIGSDYYSAWKKGKSTAN